MNEPLVEIEEVADGLIEEPAAPAEPPQPGPPRLPPDPLFHRTLLLLCLGIVVLSIVLSVRDRRQVLLPVLGSPLPELCLMKRYMGHGCPGWGMTRCFISLGP